MNKIEMLKTLPKLYRSDKWVNELYGVTVMDEVNILTNTNYGNLFFKSLDDYGCSLYERDLLIDKKATLEDRRYSIKTKWLATHRCTLSLLQQIVKSYFNDKCTVTYDGNATVTHTKPPSQS